MARHRTHSLFGWLKRFLPAAPAAPTELERAKAIVAAYDKGAIPLNPAIINDIARSLGLEVSRKAPVGETIERLRAAIGRGDSVARSR